MVIDNLFYAERRSFRKMSLLFTIPCAILPMIMACAGLMSLPFEPMFFRYDWLIWLSFYGVYMSGLYFSWQHHKKVIPALLFLLHLVSIGVYLWLGQMDFFGYTTILSIILTSVANQFFRVGSFECEACTLENGSCAPSADTHQVGSGM